MFTNSPNEHFILERHPGHPQVVLASPCSGHGYKFCSVIGEVLANLATGDGATRHGIGFRRLRRAALSQAHAAAAAQVPAAPASQFLPWRAREGRGFGDARVVVQHVHPPSVAAANAAMAAWNRQADPPPMCRLA